MKIVSIGDSFHEVSKLVFFSVKNIEKYFNMSSAENFTQSASVKRRDCVPGELMLSLVVGASASVGVRVSTMYKFSKVCIVF